MLIEILSGLGTILTGQPRSSALASIEDLRVPKEGSWLDPETTHDTLLCRRLAQSRLLRLPRECNDVKDGTQALRTSEWCDRVTQEDGMEKGTPERKRSVYLAGGPEYKAPTRWRFAAIALVPIVILAMELNIPSHPTWTWVLPGLAEVCSIACMVLLWRFPSPKRSALAALGQLVFGIGALALLAVPIGM